MRVDTYRDDIQILRGISILLVLCFHLNFAWLPSGFLGVDIFFVVSGYLMAFIYPNISLGSLKEFYNRRLKRILPAYYVVLIAVLLFAFFRLLKHEFSSLSEYALYSSALIPNVGFWKDNSYFSKEIFKPILHFWSLGVELQFYLAFPLIMILLRKSRVLFAALAIICLLLCFQMTEISAKTSFFLTPFRSWLGVIGFAMIIWLTTLKINELQHPKFNALWIALASTWVLIFSLPKIFMNSIFE